MAYISFDPWHQRLIAEFPDMTDTDLADSVSQADQAFHLWCNASTEERCSKLFIMNDNLLTRRKELSEIMAAEMGKPVSQGLAEIEKCALLCQWYAENAPNLMLPEKRISSARESYVYREPQGIILGIMPWNFPFWQVFRFIVPTMTGGNAVLLKHASNVPRCALAIEEIVTASDYPAGLYRSIFPTHGQVRELIADQRVRGVSLTGSNNAGKEIAAIAGMNLKKLVMELGGSDPFIVFPDADLEKAAGAAVLSRFQNSGQSCIASKRIIIHEEIYGEFREKFLDKVRALRTGAPLDHDSEIGPLVTVAAADGLKRQLDETIRAGAMLLCGGHSVSGRPALFMPAVVENVPLESPLAREETFGPVAPLFRFSLHEEAVQMANNTPFGLGATIWTADERLATDMARKIDTGTVAINGFVRSEPGLPFGGVKESGYGRELAAEGLFEFLNFKTISFLCHKAVTEASLTVL